MRVALLTLLALVLGCAPEGGDSDPQVEDTSNPVVQGLGGRAQDLFLALLMPMELPGLTTGLAHFSDNGCPTVEQSADGMIIQGDCDWEQGVLEGSVSFSDTAILWDAWSMSFGDGTVVAVSGQQSLGDDGAMVSDLLVEADVRQVPLLPSGVDSYTFAGHRVSDWGAYATAATDPVMVELSGELELASLGHFVVSGAFHDAATCPKFWDSVDLTLQGADAITFTSDPDPCDLCFHWAVASGGEGDFCLGGG